MQLPLEINKDLFNVLRADEFLRLNDILGPAQINNIIIVTLSAIPKIKNIYLDIDRDKKEICTTLFLNTWNMWFANKNKIVESIKNLWGEYIPQYSIKIKFSKYVGKKNITIC